MADYTFRKALVLTDLHFGRNGNSPVANQDNIDFLEWVIDRARTWDVDTVFMMGDWHDNRHTLHALTMSFSLRGMDMLHEAFRRIVWLPGNHDLLYRERRDVSSVEFARHLPNIEIIRDPVMTGDVALLPWLVGDEPEHVRGIRSRYVFGHLEMPGFMMNAQVMLPDAPHLLKADQFEHQEFIFTGHFHKRQTVGPVCYTGNIMPFDFSDAWDEERGAMFLEWGKEPRFEAWPDQPLYRTIKLSALLDAPDRLLKPKMTVRVARDIPLSFAEEQDIREALRGSYSLRKVELTSTAVTAEALNETAGAAPAHQSVDQTVMESLGAVETTGLDAGFLVDLYRSLAEDGASLSPAFLLSRMKAAASL